MTFDEAAKLEVGNNVKLVRDGKRIHDGRVTQTAKRWFMVTWYDGTPQVIDRTRNSILLSRIELKDPVYSQCIR